MKRRILSFVLVLSLLICAAVRPQRADAVVATTAAVAASAAAILTACGVSYWAATQTDAIDYIAGKLDDYLDSIDEPDITYEEWLEIGSTSQLFDVVAGGVMQFGAGVANKLLDFCRWVQDDEGIESGGDVVGNGSIAHLLQYTSGGYTGTVLYINDGAQVILSIDAFQQSTTSDKKFNVLIPVDNSNNSITVTITNIDSSVRYFGSWNVKSSNGDDLSSYSGSGQSMLLNSSRTITVTDDYIILGVSIGNNGGLKNGNIYFTVSSADLSNPSTATITPSDFVNIPAAIDSDAVFAVKPSVDLASGDSVDDAAEAILDGITSEDGLSSTVEDTPDTSWGWLYTLLVSIAEAITDGVADIKQAVLGLADSIYNKFSTVLQDIKTGISTIVNSITSAVSQLLSAIQSLPTTIYSQFTQILQDIKTGIQGIALDIYTDLINALTYVFVPSQTFIDTYVASLYATFDNHFSILSYPFSILGEFITRASGIGSPEPMFTWGNIYEPFSGKLLIAAGSYNLNSMLSNQTFAQVYSIYMIVVKGLISFAFLKFLYSWFCDVFKMREDDFSSPLDVEDGDDAEDFDGYDDYYTS